MNNSENFDSFFNEIPEENLLFVRKLGEIMDRVDAILKLKKMSRTALADKLGKKPSEISKWFNTPHNLTLKSITKLETVLDCELITISQEGTDLFHEIPSEALKFQFDNWYSKPEKSSRLPEKAKSDDLIAA